MVLQVDLLHTQWHADMSGLASQCCTTALSCTLIATAVRLWYVPPRKLLPVGSKCCSAGVHLQQNVQQTIHSAGLVEQ